MTERCTPPTEEATWTAHGLDCLVLRMPPPLGHPCGYVRVRETHPWHGVGYSDRLPGLAGPLDAWDTEYGTTPYEMTPCGHVDVHGGITLAGSLFGREGFWFGFDCAHAGDWSLYDPTGRIWTTEDVKAETEQLAEQIARFDR